MKLPETLTTPGLIDFHVHLREPGTNAAETIATGTRAALLGGFALIGDMPNNAPNPTWTKERMLEKHAIARETAYIPTTFHAGSQPESDNIGELEKMAKLSLWLKLYGDPTTNNTNTYVADDFWEIASEWHRVAPNKPIGFHPGDHNLEEMIAKVAGELEHPLFIHHVHSSEQVRIIQRAKAKGLSVASAVTPHHLLKTMHDTRSEGWYARMKPPLARELDAEMLMHHVATGDIEVIETDHAPHAVATKEKAESENPEGIEDKDHATCFGVPGIEFAAKLMFYQVKRDFISLERVVDAMSTKPAELLGLRLDPRTKVVWNMTEYRINDESLQVESNAQWSPFLGKLAIGEVKQLQVSGRTLIDTNETGISDIVGRDPRVITRRGELV